jgi:hypothetical protein
MTKVRDTFFLLFLANMANKRHQTENSTTIKHQRKLFGTYTPILHFLIILHIRKNIPRNFNLTEYVSW